MQLWRNEQLEQGSVPKRVDEVFANEAGQPESEVSLVETFDA
jgi:hypothetical protein